MSDLNLPTCLGRVNKLRKHLFFASSSTRIPVRGNSLRYVLSEPAPAAVSQPTRIFLTAIFLVVVPVFFQAPLVRSLPWLSLALTGTWLMAGVSLISRGSNRLLGDMLIGFSWTWLAGSLYWGWLRWEPFVHLPVEALGLPVVVVCLMRGVGRVGSYFYLGSLFGTAVTDLYIYCVDLVPTWRQVMAADPEWVPVLLEQAVVALQTPGAVALAVLLALGLLIVGVAPLQSRRPYWRAFSGAVLSTLIVDLLFLGSALFV